MNFVWYHGWRIFGTNMDSDSGNSRINFVWFAATWDIWRGKRSDQKRKDHDQKTNFHCFHLFFFRQKCFKFVVLLSCRFYPEHGANWKWWFYLKRMPYRQLSDRRVCNLSRFDRSQCMWLDFPPRACSKTRNYELQDWFFLWLNKILHPRSFAFIMSRNLPEIVWILF